MPFEPYAAQAGPIVAAAAQGVGVHEKMIGLGEVLAAKASGTCFQEWREDQAFGTGFVIYNSVGLGIQDAAMVEHLLAQQQAQPE
jgi:hypothetical protein